MHANYVTSLKRAHTCGGCAARVSGICGGATDQELPRIGGAAAIVEFQRGKTFIREGDAATFLYIVILGSAKLYKALPDGRRQIIGFTQATTLLGLTGGKTYDVTAEAVEDIQMCRMPSAHLHLVASELSAMGLRMLSLAMADLGRAQDHALLLGRKTAAEKVASFLLLQAPELSSKSAGPLEVRLPMTRMDIADYLGTTPETISRSLWALDRLGAITITGAKGVIIRDLARLETIAHALFGKPVAARTDVTFRVASASVIRSKTWQRNRARNRWGAHLRSKLRSAP